MTKTPLFALLLTAQFAAASTWEIDPGHASVDFSVRHMLVSNVKGTLGKVKGQVQLDDADVTKSQVKATIDVKGINTREPKRDKHLRSKDFLDVARFPVITFQSKHIEKRGDGHFKVTGDLTMHGVSREVTLDAKLTKSVKNPFNGAVTRGIAASTVINRKDFGLSWNLALEAGGVLIGEEVTVGIDAELIQRDASVQKKAPKKKPKKSKQ